MAIVAPLLAMRRTMRAPSSHLTRQVLAIVREEATCRRLMTVPGVGPITALAFGAAVCDGGDDPDRFNVAGAIQ